MPAEPAPISLMVGLCLMLATSFAGLVAAILMREPKPVWMTAQKREIDLVDGVNYPIGAILGLFVVLIVSDEAFRRRREIAAYTSSVFLTVGRKRRLIFYPIVLSAMLWGWTALNVFF